MDNNKIKNIVIGVLMGFIFIMALGYAAFATQLTINGYSKVASDASNAWAIGFDNSQINNYVIDAKGKEKPTASIKYTSPVSVDSTISTDATINAKLIVPGDTIKFILPIKNKGRLDASLTNPTLSVNGTKISGNRYVTNSGNIEITVDDFSNKIVTKGSSANLTITIKYLETGASNGEKVNCTVTFGASQI